MPTREDRRDPRRNAVRRNFQGENDRFFDQGRFDRGSGADLHRRQHLRLRQQGQGEAKQQQREKLGCQPGHKGRLFPVVQQDLDVPDLPVAQQVPVFDQGQPGFLELAQIGKAEDIKIRCFRVYFRKVKV